MKPHIDDNNIHEPDIFAAMLYLNDNFTGGSTMFEDIEIKPKPGKLIIFSNNKHLHYVSEVGGAERFVLSFWYSRPKCQRIDTKTLVKDSFLFTFQELLVDSYRKILN